MIPISQVDLPPETETLVREVLASGQLASGPMVARLEDAFAQIAGTEHAMAVSSGTAALVAALDAAEIGPGDEVITTPFTFVATMNAIVATGATVRFVDVDEDLNLDAQLLDAAVTPNTKAIVPVHLYGQPADMETICQTSRNHDLQIIEDAAQAIGATYRSRPVGSFGVGCFSLYATKNVTTGEGGVVTTNDSKIADRVRLYRNQGMRARYQYESVGFNHRLTDLQAAVGLPQLDRLRQSNAQRQANAKRLTEGLADLPGVVLPGTHHDRSHVFHQYTIQITSAAPVGRDEAVNRLAERGVQAAVYYPGLVFNHAPFRDSPQVIRSEVPRAKTAATQVISLPVRPGLTDSEVEQIIDAMKDVVR